MKKTVLFKAFIALLVLIVLLSLNKFSPVIGAQTTIAQLQDSYTASTGIKFWKAFKQSQWFLYIGFLALLFRKELLILIRK